MTLIGQQIKKARENSGLSQRELGEKCGWGEDSQSRVSNYERGDREPKASDLLVMAKVLGVEPAYFFQQGEDPLPRIPIRNWDLSDTTETVPIYAGSTLGPRAFALIAANDMNDFSIKAGEYLIIDPDRSPQDNQLCVIQTGNQAALRIFRQDGDKAYLLSVLPGIPAESFGDAKLLGAVEFSLFIRRSTHH